MRYITWIEHSKSMERMRRFACQLPIEIARRWYGLDGSEGARVRPAIRDCSLLLQRYCSASCKEKSKGY